MATLSENLDFIWRWLEEVNPDPNSYNFNFYQPGLSRQKITNLTKDLPLTLPEEVYQLYMWKNGLGVSNHYFPHRDVSLSTPFLFFDHLGHGISLDFCPLQDAIEMYEMMREQYLADLDSEDEDWNEKYFPFAWFESDECLYIDCGVDPAPVAKWEAEWPGPPARIYKSLNFMFQVIVECCEKRIYQIVPDKYSGEGYLRIEIDETKWELERGIFEKHNT